MRLSEFVLRYRLGEGEWQVFPLTSREIQVGRDGDNDLILDHREVSRDHFQIRFEEDGFLLIDLGSSNGTQLDGIPLTPQIPSSLRPGQMIIVGDFTFLLAKASEDSTHVSKELLPFLLRYRFGTGTWQTFPIEPGEKILGRDPNNDFYLNDSEVSWQHARLQIGEEEIWLTDLGSTNGTQIGGISLVPDQPYNLQLGQPFSIGNFILQVDEPSRFYMAPSAAAGKVDRGAGPSSTLAVGGAVPKPVQAMNLMSRKRTTIGRASDNDIVLSHPLVSRYHAVIERFETDFRILDLDSTSGVFVNDRQINKQVYLKDWDHIRIGSAVFLLSGHDLQQQVIPGLKLEAKNINLQVARSRNLIHDVSLTIKPNEFVALVGPGGSGKTALLNAFSGFMPASHGQVLVNDIDLYQHYGMFRNDIGYVPQEESVHVELTPQMALDYISRLRLPPETTKEERAALVSEVLATLKLETQQNVPIARLTKGQVKRVSLGAELLIKPRFVFLDEPTRGLDPGAESEMIKLLRRLADRGCTVILVTPATKNLMLCDKVIVLAQGGFLAFFGVPEAALDYFNPYRTDRELRQKEMEFDDMHRILDDDQRGTPDDWQERFLNSPSYYRVFGIDPQLADLQSSDAQPLLLKAGKVQPTVQRISGFRQFRVLAARNWSVLIRDKVTLALMLGLAPFFGLLDFFWGRNLYDPVKGDAGRIIVLWFLGAASAILMGAISSAGEIVKETDIYQHERMVNLKIMPYVFSKLWIGIFLAMYQAGFLWVSKIVFVNPNVPASTAYLAIYMTLFLTALTGYLIGLLFSALAANRDQALLLVIGVFILQLLFAGALLPLDRIAGGKQISVFMPTRWSYEALVRITGLGERVSSDPCWAGYSQVDRLGLPDDLKESCPCMGDSIFTECADFPGILSAEYFDEATWIESRGKSIRNAEAVIYPIYEDYRQVFSGTVVGRWFVLLLIQVVLVVAVMLVQKHKD